MFEKATEAMVQDRTNSSMESGSTGEDNTNNGDLAPSTDKTNAEVVDLSSLEKFKFQEKDWTPKELQSAIMRQKDYSQKTEALSKERKYYDNLAYDLANVMRNPGLANRFKEVYPQQFHKFLDEAFSDLIKKDQVQGAQQNQEPQVPAEFMNRFANMERQLFDHQVKAAEAQIDSVFNGNIKKYPYADEVSVINKAQALIEKNTEMTPSVWNNLFKMEHERGVSIAKKYMEETVKQQKAVQSKTRDSGSGGGAPSAQPRKLTMKEATEQAIKDFSAR